MFNKFKGFISDERGAVTVDWVVLTAAVVVLAAGVAAFLGSTAEDGLIADLGKRITAAMDSIKTPGAGGGSQ